MKNISNKTSPYVPLQKKPIQNTLQNCRKTLSALKNDICQHLESTTPIRYLDAIKDTLHTHGALERRLNSVEQSSNTNGDDNSRTTKQSEMESIMSEIRSLQSTIKSITQADMA